MQVVEQNKKKKKTACDHSSGIKWHFYCQHLREFNNRLGWVFLITFNENENVTAHDTYSFQVLVPIDLCVISIH